MKPQAELAVQAMTQPRSDRHVGGSQTRQPQPLGPLHDLDPAARSQPQIRHGRAADHAAAQRLYEAGYITYMRTDGIDMAPEAVQAARDAISERYGAQYVPEQPRLYKNKAKNAQEAHECIRPTEMGQAPDSYRYPTLTRRNSMI